MIVEIEAQATLYAAESASALPAAQRHFQLSYELAGVSEALGKSNAGIREQKAQDLAVKWSSFTHCELYRCYAWCG